MPSGRAPARARRGEGSANGAWCNLAGSMLHPLTQSTIASGLLSLTTPLPLCPPLAALGALGNQEVLLRDRKALTKHPCELLGKQACPRWCRERRAVGVTIEPERDDLAIHCFVARAGRAAIVARVSEQPLKGVC